MGEDVNGLRGPIKDIKTKALPATLNKNMLPKTWKDAKYLSFDIMKKVILDIIKGELGDDEAMEDNDDEEKGNAVDKEMDINIEWNHREPPGNRKEIECIKEYRQNVLKEREKGDEFNDVLIVSHRGALYYVSEELMEMDQTVWASECGWFNITPQEVASVVSSLACEVC